MAEEQHVKKSEKQQVIESWLPPASTTTPAAAPPPTDKTVAGQQQPPQSESAQPQQQLSPAQLSEAVATAVKAVLAQQQQQATSAAPTPRTMEQRLAELETRVTEEQRVRAVADAVAEQFGDLAQTMPEEHAEKFLASCGVLAELLQVQLQLPAAEAAAKLRAYLEDIVTLREQAKQQAAAPAAAAAETSAAEAIKPQAAEQPPKRLSFRELAKVFNLPDV